MCVCECVCGGLGRLKKFTGVRGVFTQFTCVTHIVCNVHTMSSRMCDSGLQYVCVCLWCVCGRLWLGLTGPLAGEGAGGVEKGVSGDENWFGGEG